MMILEIAELVVGVEKFRNLLKFFVINPFAVGVRASQENKSAATQPAHDEKHPAKPVFRLHLQLRWGADCCLRALSVARTVVESDDRECRDVFEFRIRH